MPYYYYRAGHTPVGNLRFDSTGNAYQVMSAANDTAVYVIGADGIGRLHPSPTKSRSVPS